VSAEQIEELFDIALTCTILAPSGPRKARLLAILYNDERCKSNQFYDLLAKMFLGAVIR
jgi:COP9 signalosome complex subunit 4